MHACAHTHALRLAPGSDLKSLAVVSHPMEALGTELRTSERTAGTLNCGAVSPALVCFVFSTDHRTQDLVHS